MNFVVRNVGLCTGETSHVFILYLLLKKLHVCVCLVNLSISLMFTVKRKTHEITSENKMSRM